MTVAEIDRALDAERKLSEILNDYAGQWVGVCDHGVVASAASLGELVEQIEASGQTNVEVIQVPKDTSAACFF
jgi:Family of unknown function (DUF5678)